MTDLRKTDWSVRPISYKQAMDVVVERHYLHRKAPCSEAWGLFPVGSPELVGVITYGTPSSAPTSGSAPARSWCAHPPPARVSGVSDDVPSGGESFLIGNTCRLVSKEWIVSFADTAQGHVGTVYQAANWLYTGLSAKRTDWTVTGMDKHGQTIADKHTADELRALYGDAFTLKPRPRKHRYVYINATRKRRKTLLSQLRYPIQPYPKENR